MSLWSESQVAALNEWQACDWVHPFTCPNRDDGSHLPNAVLTATMEGWTCPHCAYHQTWAHDFMFHGAPPHPFDEWRK